jgi:hypothetical protein
VPCPAARTMISRLIGEIPPDVHGIIEVVASVGRVAAAG